MADKIDWQSLRRVVTCDDKNGRSDVLIDDGPAKMLAIEENGLAEIWQAVLTDPDVLLGKVDQLADQDISLEPDENALKVRWFTVPVENEASDPAAREAKAAFGFAAVQAAHARVDTARHPMMHKTDTLDAIILVHGEVDLLLDDGQAQHLKPGNVVIQQATNHAWVNRGTETALLVAILINRR